MKITIVGRSGAARTVVSGVLVALFGVGFTGGTSCIAAAQRATDEQTAYDFQRHYQAGEVDRYKAEIVLTTNSPQTGGHDQIIRYTMVVRETVKSLTPDNTLTLVVEYEQAIASSEGQTLDFTAKMPRVTQVRYRQGRDRITTEGGSDPNARMMLRMIAQVDQAALGGLPDKPVKVGETWKLIAPDPSVKWSGGAALVAVESLNGAKTLRVNYETDSSSAEAAVTRTHSGATLLVDVLTGKTIKLAFRTDAQVGQSKTTVDMQYNHIEPPAGPVSFVRRVYRVGEADHYQINVITTTNDPQTGGNDRIVKYALLIRETVKDVAPDGTTTLLDEVEKAGVSIDNRDVDLTATAPTVTQSRTVQGDFQIKVEGGDNQLANLILQVMAQICRTQNDVFSLKPIKPGGFWNFTRTDGADVKTMGTVALELAQGLNGAKALKLKYAANMSGTGATAARSHEDATVLLEARTGKTLTLNSRSTALTGGNKRIMDIAYSPVSDKATARGNGWK